MNGTSRPVARALSISLSAAMAGGIVKLLTALGILALCLTWNVSAVKARGALASAGATITPISVVTIDDSTSTYVTVQVWPGDFVRATREDDTVEFIPVHRIRAIRGRAGHDLTRRVLVDGRKVVAGDPDPDDPDFISIPANYKAPLLRGRPLPWQRGFPIIQAGILLPIHDEDIYSELPPVIAVTDLGYMRNLSPKISLGATLSLSFDNDYVRVGLKPRLRQWITRTTSLDVAAGAFYCVDDTTGEADHTGVGFVGEASLTFGDFIAISNMIEISNVDERVNFSPEILHPSIDSGTEIAWYVGLKAGGELGIPAVILLGLIPIAAEVSQPD